MVIPTIGGPQVNYFVQLDLISLILSPQYMTSLSTSCFSFNTNEIFSKLNEYEKKECFQIHFSSRRFFC